MLYSEKKSTEYDRGLAIGAKNSDIKHFPPLAKDERRKGELLCLTTWARLASKCRSPANLIIRSHIRLAKNLSDNALVVIHLG